MIMLHANTAEDGEDETFEKMEKDDMGQFGLVAKAASDNTTVFDIDGDEQAELLIADSNHVRAVPTKRNRPMAAAPAGRSSCSSTPRIRTPSLISLTTLGRRIIAADEENNRLVVFEADDGGTWSEVESLTVQGFPLGTSAGGRFTGDDAEHSRLRQRRVRGDQTRGQRQSLSEVGAWRTDEDRRLHYDLAVGDVNADGYADMVSSMPASRCSSSSPSMARAGCSMSRTSRSTSRNCSAPGTAVSSSLRRS